MTCDHPRPLSFQPVRASYCPPGRSEAVKHLSLPSIRSKILLATVALTLVPMAVAGIYVFLVVPEFLEVQAEDRLIREVNAKQTSLLQLLGGVEEDLRFLRDSPALKQLLEAADRGDGTSDASLSEAVAEEWKVFSESMGRYRQIRYIDEQGYERVRINKDQRQAPASPAQELQNKSDRYYFIETMKLESGALFVSTIDLNQEQGRIEVPYRPVLRYAAPVFRENGVRAGVVILNLDAIPFLMLAEEQAPPGSTSFVIDEDGHYLVHPEVAKEWGSPRDLGHGASVRADYPELFEVLRSGSAQFQPQVWSSESALIAYSTITTLPRGAPSWTLVTEVPKNVVLAPVRTYKVYFGLVFGAVALFIVGLDTMVARRLTMPLAQLRDGVIRLGRGERGYRLSVRGGDEIEEIVAEFNEMAFQLETAHSTLEDQVQQATQSLTRRNQQLKRVYETGIDLVAEHSLEKLLQKIADASRVIVDAQYSALGVLDQHGKIGRFYVSGLDLEDRARIGIPPSGMGMFRTLLTEGRSLRIDAVAADPRFTGFPTYHPDITTLLGVPIASQGDIHGDLYVGNKAEGEPFTVEDQELITLLASMAAVAIGNARLLAQEQATVARLQELDQLKSDFVATVSHELRSPVASIHGYAELLSPDRGRFTDAQKAQLLDRITHESSHLITLVEDVLSVSRIDSGRQEYLMRPMALDGLAEEVIAEVRPRAGDRTLSFKHRGGSVVIRGDGGFLRQALLNLLDNALKFSASTAPVELSVEVDHAAGEARVTVTDRGIGMAPQHLSRLFEKFSRIRTGATEQIPGTGLGLYITKQIVEAHNGRIWVESEQDVGSRFTLALPLHQG